MTQLNSSFQTSFQRRYLPAIIAFGMLTIVGVAFAYEGPIGIAVAVATLVPCALVYFGTFRALVGPIADCVVLDGRILRVTRAGKESLIPVEAIRAIQSGTWLSPNTITLDLVGDTEVGRSITFIPPATLPSLRDHPILAPLRAVMRPAEAAPQS